MGCAKSTPTLDPMQHDLTQRDTGTLVYQQRKKDGAESAETHLDKDLFFGLNIDYSKIDRLEEIGQGTYGQVFRCRYEGKKLAVKELFLSEIPTERMEILEDFTKEVRILSILRHENIVRFMGAVQTDPHYCLLFELCEGSVHTLLKMARQKKVLISWKIVITVALDAAIAVDYLHSMEPQILHRDLKAENLLLTSHFRCKLTDFGLSRAYDGGMASKMTVCGTPCWVAPEIFRGDPYNEKVDQYSFGIVLWELFAGQKPHADEDCIELPYLVGKKGLRPKLLPHCPKSVNDIMEACWAEDMNTRPDFKVVIEKLRAIEKEIGDAGKLGINAHDTGRPWRE